MPERGALTMAGTFSEWLMARCDVADVGYGTPCWTWRGSKPQRGYARIAAPRQFCSVREQVSVHRLAYQMLAGEIPAGLTIDHLCRNTLCCNPAHLEPVTKGENTRRIPREVRRAGAMKMLVTRGIPRALPGGRCAKGHEYTPENSTPLRNGAVRCRTCHIEYMREYDRRPHNKGRRHRRGVSVAGRPPAPTDAAA